jgi:hypothetical protein
VEADIFLKFCGAGATGDFLFADFLLRGSPPLHYI